MVARRGRRYSPAAQRLILLGSLNVIAVVVLITLMVWGDGSSSEAKERGEAEGGPAPVELAERPKVGTPPPDARDPALQRGVETAIANAMAEARRLSESVVTPGNSSVAVHVVEVGSGRELVAVQADQALRPASALKLVTCSAATTLLGSDWRFETVFEASGPVEDGRLAGDLVVRAAGDPLFREEAAGDLSAWLDDLAEQLAAAGISAVDGALVLDEGDFLTPQIGPGWPDSSQHWAHWCARSGGFSANAGMLTAVVTPMSGEASVRLRPRHHGLSRRGTVETGGRTLNVAVGATTSTVTVRGTIPSTSAPYRADFSHPDPVRLFGESVRGGLSSRGIKFGRSEVVRERGRPPGTRVAVLRSPLQDLLVPILGESRNSVADQLLLGVAHAIGEPGTREGAQAAVARALAQLGCPVEGLVQVDGSGLSRDNRISTRQFTALLAAVLAHPDADSFFEALPVGGESGTLAKRMRHTSARGRVHAKTGWINGTSALAGVVRTLDDRKLVFAILVNHPVASGLNPRCWKPMGDEIARLLVESEATR